MKKSELQECYLVQKSRPLFSLWASDFTLIEFKLLDIYLSKIDSHNPLNRTVEFTRKELCDIFGISQIRPEVLTRHLKKLQETSVTLHDNEKVIDIVILFSRSRAELDEEGVCQLELTCSPEAMRYFFSVENIGYFKYKINAITHITSVHSYLMFLYIEYNRFRKSWEVSVDDLKRFLNCDQVESYKGFKEFNDKVLKKVQNELSEKANCLFEYSTVKRGRTVTHIRFKVLPTIENGVIVTDNDQLNITESDNAGVLDRIAMACQLKFGELEINNIYNLLSRTCIPDYVKGDTEEDRQYNFVYMMYNKLIAREQEQKGKRRSISNRFNYFYKMLETEIRKAAKEKAEQEQQKKPQERKEQSYDIDEFEKFAITFSKNTKKRE